MMKLIEQLKDPYERKARVTPGLLLALPLLVPLVAVYGPKHAVLTGVLAVLGGCGAIFALANIARGRGKALEEALVKRWGGLPTTILLRHRDDFFDRHTKERYHEAIRAKLGIPIPSAAEEAVAPDGADQAYIAATRRLRELTRGDTKLLQKENIAYGFHRNMTAMRPVGVVSCLLGLTYGLLVAGMIRPTEPYVDLTKIVDPGLAAGVTMLISAALLASWLFYFNPSAVWRVGCVYAERLFERLPSLKTSARKTTAAKDAFASTGTHEKHPIDSTYCPGGEPTGDVSTAPHRRPESGAPIAEAPQGPLPDGSRRL